jgi:hypothetical protein
MDRPSTPEDQVIHNVDLLCPWAPIKRYIQCEGCRLVMQGRGGENQLAHIGPGGCISE